MSGAIVFIYDKLIICYQFTVASRIVLITHQTSPVALPHQCSLFPLLPLGASFVLLNGPLPKINSYIVINVENIVLIQYNPVDTNQQSGHILGFLLLPTHCLRFGEMVCTRNVQMLRKVEAILVCVMGFVVSFPPAHAEKKRAAG